MLHSKQDLSSLTRDRDPVPAAVEAGVLITGQPEKSLGLVSDP